MTLRPGLALWIAAHLGIAGVGPVHGQGDQDIMDGFQLRTLETPHGAIDYRLHGPAVGESPRSLVVVLHGCLQDAEDIAAGTRWNEVADERGFAVLYPQQDPAKNPQRCWNWFDADQQRADGPEVTRIATLVETAVRELGVPPDRVDLAGISAGAAMATVLAVTRPGLFRRVAVHSGIPWGAASDIAGGLAAMRSGGPETIDLQDPRLQAFAEGTTPLEVLVLQGREDHAVARVNGVRSAERWVELFGLRGRTLVEEDQTRDDVGGRRVDTRRWADGDGIPVVTLVEIHGLGHAWSGGDPAGSYADPKGPSASRMIADFFRSGR